MPYQRALGTAFRLLDLGFFRIGGEAYAEINNSYGLATIQKEHVTIEAGAVIFNYAAKSGQERYVALADDLVLRAVRDLLTRSGGGPELLASTKMDSTGMTSAPTTSTATSRTCSAMRCRPKTSVPGIGTVIAAVVLWRRPMNARELSVPASRAVSAAMKEVAGYLGNTPAVARASYVDPRVIDLFNDGATISPALADDRC